VLDFLFKVSHLPQVSVITRLRLDACLYDPAPPREAGKTGRTALKGKRQPKLAQRLHDANTIWQKHRLSWYGGTTREMEIATGTALWYHSPVPPVAIRWVLIRDPAGQDEPLALLCTDQQTEAVQIVEWFVLRWTVDVTFHEVRAHLGVETRRQWSDLAILRTTPADARHSFRSSPCLLSSCWRDSRFRFVRRPGIPKSCRPFRRRWLICVSISGPPSFCRCRLPNTTPFTSHEFFATIEWKRSLLLLEQHTSFEHVEKVYMR
jgi:hypothetical protein